MATVNPWNKFKQLLPTSQQLRATVVSVEASGQVLIECNGRRWRVSSNINITAGELVLIVDNTITQTLPNLPHARVEVS